MSVRANVYLTITERRILELFVKGYQPKQMPDKLGITYNTTKFYIRLLKAKVNAQTTPQLMAIAVWNNLVSASNIPEFQDGT